MSPQPHPVPRNASVIPDSDLPAETTHEPTLLTLEQAARLLAVPTSWLKQRVSAREIACTRLGRHIRFTRDQVDALIAACEQPVALRPLTGLTRRSRRTA